MKANCGWLFQDCDGKAFARSDTEYQLPLAFCIFCMVETMSGTAEAMGSTSLFKPQESAVSLHEPSAFFTGYTGLFTANSLVLALQLLACH